MTREEELKELKYRKFKQVGVETDYNGLTKVYCPTCKETLFGADMYDFCPHCVYLNIVHAMYNIVFHGVF